MIDEKMYLKTGLRVCLLQPPGYPVDWPLGRTLRARPPAPIVPGVDELLSVELLSPLRLHRVVVPQAELPLGVRRPEPRPHELVDDVPDVHEGGVVALGHAGHNVADEVLEGVGGAFLLQVFWFVLTCCTRDRI